MKGTKIEWAHHTFNPWWGCEKVSPGCTNCYAEAFAKRTGKAQWGADEPRAIFGQKHWNEPLVWNRAAAERGVRERVFCASMADVFEEHRGVFLARRRLWELISATPALDWLLLTKRPQNVEAMVPGRWLSDWPRNAWVGTSVEDQERADRRIPDLLEIPARVRFLSCEPLLGPIDFSDVTKRRDAVSRLGAMALAGIHWVIVGGESGPKARECDVAWVRSILAQCREARVPAFVKQLGKRPRADLEEIHRWPAASRAMFETVLNEVSHGGMVERLRLRDAKGGDPAEWPEDLRVRELPNAAEVTS